MQLLFSKSNPILWIPSVRCLLLHMNRNLLNSEFHHAQKSCSKCHRIGTVVIGIKRPQRRKCAGKTVLWNLLILRCLLMFAEVKRVSCGGECLLTSVFSFFPFDCPGGPQAISFTWNLLYCRFLVFKILSWTLMVKNSVGVLLPFHGWLLSNWVF